MNYQALAQVLNSKTYACIFYDNINKKVLAQNDLALQHPLMLDNLTYDDNISPIPSESNLYATILEAISKYESDKPSCFKNIQSLNHNNLPIICNIEVGMFNEDLQHLYITIEIIKDYPQENHTQLTSKTSMISFIMEDSDELLISSADPSFYSTFSYSRRDFEETTNNSFLSIFDEKDREFYKRTIHENLKTDKSFFIDVLAPDRNKIKQNYLLNIHKIEPQMHESQIYGVLIPTELKDNYFPAYTSNYEYLRVIQDLSPGSVFILNPYTKTLKHKNKNALTYGLPLVIEGFPESLKESELMHEEDVPDYIDYINKVYKGEILTQRARVWNKETKSYEWFQTDARVINDSNGEPVEIIGQIIHIQDTVNLEKKAFEDPMTKVLNKTSFEEAVSDYLSSEDSKDSMGALMFLDLDNFKYVNDNYGHLFGDHLLTTLASRLKKNVRSNDLIGRVGGDEFVIFLKDIPHKDLASQKAERILESLRKEVSDKTYSHTIKSSIGISISPNHGTNYKTLYDNADKALYISKERGKDVATMFDC